MQNRLVVSTECPNCGAPLDFSEGSNAVRCQHCQSNLLVTGRKQILTYSIRPKLSAHRAADLAAAAQSRESGSCRIMKQQLYFVPYYRFTGQDFLWEVVPGEAGSNDALPPTSLIETVFSESHKEVQFQDRYIEKNFLAADVEGLGVYSLGIRPAVLRLELFSREALEALGRIVPVTTGTEAARTQGMKTPDSQTILHRKVLGNILSIIFFPFWILEIHSQDGERLTIVDAVAETVIKTDAPPSLYASLDQQPSSDPCVIGFRPLVCPNCAWDLPCNSDDVIFVCSSCHRGWQILGTQLSEIPYEIAARPDSARDAATQYLPFWILQVEIHQQSLRFFVPAFRYQRLKFLSDLGMRLSQACPSYPIAKEISHPLHGCYYDLEDAGRMADFIHVGLSSKNPTVAEALEGNALSITHAQLTWLPFKVEGNFLTDPFTGSSLPRNLLL